MSSVHDPLGFVAPFILPAKIILQDLSDDQTMEAVVGKTSKTEELFCEKMHKPTRFMHFTDAAESGYDSVSYLRQVS